jgi:hypothetical protein
MGLPNVVLVKFLDVSNCIFAETIKNKTNISYRKKRSLKRITVQKNSYSFEVQEACRHFPEKAVFS